MRRLLDALVLAIGVLTGASLSTGCPDCPVDCAAGPALVEGVYRVDDLRADDPVLAGVDADVVEVRVLDAGRRIEFAWDDSAGPVRVVYDQRRAVKPDECL